MAAFLTVNQHTVWRTSDGVQHATREQADQHVLTDQMVELLVGYGVASAGAAQEAVRAFHGDRHLVRAWLDACDAAEGNRR